MLNLGGGGKGGEGNSGFGGRGGGGGGGWVKSQCPPLSIYPWSISKIFSGPCLYFHTFDTSCCFLDFLAVACFSK